MGDSFQFHGKRLFASSEKTQLTQDGRCEEETGDWQTRVLTELDTASRSKTVPNPFLPFKWRDKHLLVLLGF